MWSLFCTSKHNLVLRRFSFLLYSPLVFGKEQFFVGRLYRLQLLEVVYACTFTLADQVADGLRRAVNVNTQVCKQSLCYQHTHPRAARAPFCPLLRASGNRRAIAPENINRTLFSI